MIDMGSADIAFMVCRMAWYMDMGMGQLAAIPTVYIFMQKTLAYLSLSLSNRTNTESQ